MDKPSVLFLHSLWRSGSTYLFEVFRRVPERYFAFQEPLHETMLGAVDDRESLRGMLPEATVWMRHPALESGYYEEAYQTFDLWREKITKPIIYDHYFRAEDADLVAFLNALDLTNDRRTVIQECRTASRIGAIRREMGGIHLFTWRNPWDQWWSYKISDYFNAATQLICHAQDAPASMRAFCERHGLVPFHADSIAAELAHFQRRPLRPELSYQAFFLLWAYGWLEAREQAHLLINIDTLSADPSYRKKTVASLRELGIADISFDDCSAFTASFGDEDKAFFADNERQVFELLALDGHGADALEALGAAREAHTPSMQAARTVPGLSETLKRARQTVLRLEREGLHNWQHMLGEQEHYRKQAEERQLADERMFRDEQAAAVEAVEEQRRADADAFEEQRRAEAEAFEGQRRADADAFEQHRSSLEQQHAEAIAAAEAVFETRLAEQRIQFEEAHSAMRRAAEEDRQATIAAFEEERRLALNASEVERKAATAAFEAQVAALVEAHRNGFAQLAQAHEHQVARLEEARTAELAALEAKANARIAEIRFDRDLLEGDLRGELKQQEEAYLALSEAGTREREHLTQKADKLAANIVSLERQGANDAQAASLRETALSDSLQEARTALASEVEAGRALMERVALLGAEEGRLRGELGAVYQSWSWRLTGPFRRFSARSERAKIAWENGDLRIAGTAGVLPPVPVRASDGQIMTRGQMSGLTLDELLALPTEAFVHAAYKVLLGRRGDESGVQHYVAQLMGGAGRNSILRVLANSAEGRRRASHEDLFDLDGAALVNEVYMRFLGRVPDDSGMAFYLGQLQSSGDKAGLIAGLQHSPEARGFRQNEWNLASEIQLIVERENRAARSWKRFFRRKSRARETNILVEYICSAMGRVANAVTHLERQQVVSAAPARASVAQERKRRPPANNKLMQQLMTQIREDVEARKSSSVREQPRVARYSEADFDDVAAAVRNFAVSKKSR